MQSSRYVSIYLNDHLAAVTALREVARRSARSNRGSALGTRLETIAEELNRSRSELIALAGELGVRRDPLKAAAAWFAEKIGRLKLNGHLVTYSPLSRVLEVEGLLAGAELELRTWRALEAAAGRDFTERVEACERRRHDLGVHHAEAVEAALGREQSSPTR